jgi:hypothetical protein
MSNYELSLTAGEIDIALQKASSPDTSPQNTDNLVTSQGIKTYVDTAVATLTAQIAAVAGSIIPVSTAHYGLRGLYQGAVYPNTLSYVYNTTGVFALAEVSDPSGIATVSAGVITIQSAGNYMVTYSGMFAEDDNDASDYYRIRFRKDGNAVVPEYTINETWMNASNNTSASERDYHRNSATTAFNTTAAGTTVDMAYFNASKSQMYYYDLSITIIKLS